MSHIRVLICRVDDEQADTTTELARFDLPAPDISTLRAETALDELETTTAVEGHAILRRLLQAQWAEVDTHLAVQYRQSFPPSDGAGRRS
jgi:hypothetical protein